MMHLTQNGEQFEGSGKEMNKDERSLPKAQCFLNLSTERADCGTYSGTEEMSAHCRSGTWRRRGAGIFGHRRIYGLGKNLHLSLLCSDFLAKEAGRSAPVWPLC